MDTRTLHQIHSLHACTWIKYTDISDCRWHCAARGNNEPALVPSAQGQLQGGEGTNWYVKKNCVMSVSLLYHQTLCEWVSEAFRYLSQQTDCGRQTAVNSHALNLHTDGTQLVLASLSPLAFFGEMSFLGSWEEKKEGREWERKREKERKVREKKRE